MVYTLSLRGSHGRIWSRKPQVAADGLLTVIANRLVPSSIGRVGFTHTAFSPLGDTFISIDERGAIFSFEVLKNRFALVKRGGPRASAVGFAPRRAGELLVGWDDASVESYDVSSHLRLNLLKGHRNSVKSVSFHPHR